MLVIVCGPSRPFFNAISQCKIGAGARALENRFVFALKLKNKGRKSIETCQPDTFRTRLRCHMFVISSLEDLITLEFIECY